MSRKPRARRGTERGSRARQRKEREPIAARTPARDARRTALVAAAFRAIARHGADVSMEQIAAEAGITKPILYRHFGDKNGLVGAVTLRYLDELRSALARVPGSLALRERTQAQFELGLAYLEKRPGLLHFVDRQHGFRASETWEGEHVEGLLQIVRGLVAARGLDPRVAAPWAHGIGGLIMGTVLAWLREREVARGGALPREEMAHAATALLFDGVERLIGPPPASGAKGI
jgi:AcrR family transcriptional regulator